MELFVSRCDDGGATAAISCIACTAGSGGQQVIAVARLAALHFLSDHGEPLCAALSLNSPICQLAWQPGGLVLAIGCEDGVVFFYDFSALALHADDTRVNGGSITVLSWSADGSRFVSGDAVSLYIGVLLRACADPTHERNV